MKFHKFISVILHPMVIPTIGILLFLSVSPNEIKKERQYLLISIVFFSTYIVPLISLVILKTLGVINSFQLESIKERKTPLFIMLLIFYILGKMLINIPDFKELGILFYGTNVSLALVYLLFTFQIKSSLHILSLSSTLGFFLLYGSLYSINILPIAIILIILTGVLASSRLYLKAHNQKEIYLGFFIGLAGQFIAYSLL
ncbi:hypothetical protein [Polaribacter huanghezhanensis]|uniref:hypothetical protein n=1 Tax=Polaribacter huanghezhanensis TaxID=1354726 RepID=UPI0026471DE8|nr:hypothetical protein [Polaribacter huanghezhanensis]